MVVFILLYGCTTWTLFKRIEKKLDNNCTKMLWAILNKSRKQYPRTLLLYGHLSHISKSIQIGRARHVGLCWRSKNELKNDVLPRTHSYWRASVGQPAGTYLQQFCTDTVGRLEDLPEVMEDRDGCQARGKSMRAVRHDDDDDDDDEYYYY